MLRGDEAGSLDFFRPLTVEEEDMEEEESIPAWEGSVGVETAAADADDVGEDDEEELLDEEEEGETSNPSQAMMYLARSRFRSSVLKDSLSSS